jgi:hypothetical protein
MMRGGGAPDRTRTSILITMWQLGVSAVCWLLAAVAAVVGFVAILLRQLSPDAYAANACTGLAQPGSYTNAYGGCVDTHLRDGFWVPGHWPLLVAVVSLLAGLTFLLSGLAARQSADV